MKKIETMKAAYIDKYYENSKLINYKDMREDQGLKKALYKDIHKFDLKGFYPFASSYVDEDYNEVSDSSKGDLCFYFLPNYHELYIGTTGSGKTTGCVEPQLRAISSYKDKPNLFLTDPKGELFERNAVDLKEKGYELYLLNFKDVRKSDRWNPLLEMYDIYFQLKTIGEGIESREGEIARDLIRYNHIDDYTSTYYVYDGYAFAEGNSLDDYICAQKDGIIMTTEDLVTQFADMVIPIRDTKDPLWEEGANRLLKGIIYLMLEDSLEPERRFTRDMMSLKTIRDLYNKLREGISHSYSEGYVLHENLPFAY
ncbi:MAG: type IV secretory system conjugative DNA transfer family protein, partial [Bacilli bacterium]|nr:type IV secretory system conjugative DNA transfer family protein [Bacilli bacterium]